MKWIPFHPTLSLMVNSSPRLRLRVTSTAETILRGGHPWLFADSVRDQNRVGQAGELAVIFDRNNRFLAVGLYDPDSPIRVRILHCGRPLTIDASWRAQRLEDCLKRRAGHFNSSTTGYRLINGESDGWPGLVLDQYGSTLVLKIYTAAWLPGLEELTDLIGSRLHPERLVLRLSRNLQSIAATSFKRRDGEILRGSSVESPVTFLENGIVFEAEVVQGQKTGFFLDQRENRRHVESLAAGRRVLNAFSFSGGFSLYAARGGAVSATNLDISAHALAGAKRNFFLNSSCEEVSRCRHEPVQGDTFEWLERHSDRKFDLVILDPPSFAKRASEQSAALHAYKRLALLGISRLDEGGILVSASCSAHVGADSFFEAVRLSATASGRHWNEKLTTRHAPDHPASFREAEYLKAIYLEFS